jgi:hypothetical protein
LEGNVMGWFKQSLLAVGAVIALTGPAAAIPVTWQLENASFASGRTATGSFVFDADTGVYSSINIDTAPTPTNHYGIPNPSSPGNANIFIAVTGVLPDYTGTPVLAIEWSTPLTNAGGTVPFDLTGSFHFEGVCSGPSCSGVGGPFDLFVSGDATTAVAEPASITLLVAGLFGMAFSRRRVSRSAVAG